MLFSKLSSKAPDQLELHRAALLYHKQKHTLPPMQQIQKCPINPPDESIQQTLGASTDPQISIGNVFQDGISSLPVVYLPEHHLVRLRELKKQRLDSMSSPTVERQEVEEPKRFKTSGDLGKKKLVQEDQLLKTNSIAHKTPIHIRKLLRTYLLKPINCTIFNKLSEKPPKAKIEVESNTHTKEATEAATETNLTRPVSTYNSNWPILPPENSSTCNLALRPGAEQNGDCSENIITVEEDEMDESHRHNLESMEISEKITEQKLDLDIGPSEASRVKLYQTWKRRVLDLSGAKEVN
ncbi:hypothetical protein EAE96_003898 [Botrytis aclada]|nr:hypothetical protein EAE96_003898 [Botrytis aclada]